MNYTNIWTEMPISEWQQIIKESISYADVSRKVGRAPGSQFNERLRQYCDKNNINYSHLNNKNNPCGQEKYTLEEILIEHSPVSRKTLRDYLAKYNILEYKCAKCGNIGEWQGESLTLQIDHINGVRDDNRKDNLRWLCPNCHAQTDTFTGKNKTTKEVVNFTEKEAIEALKKTNNVHQAAILIGCSTQGGTWIRIKNIKEKYNIIQYDDIKKEEKEKLKEQYQLEKNIAKQKQVHYCQYCGRVTTSSNCCTECAHKMQQKCERPDRNKLKQLIRTTPFTTIGYDMYGVTDNAVRKWCDAYSLPRTKKAIMSYSDEEWEKL